MLKIYGSMLCPDCVKCCQELQEAEIPFEYCDFADSILHLKEFLKLRDEQPVFAEVRAAGKIGIPCIVRDEGTITLEWDEFVK
jgi:glutaredoxin-related protein